ncbi:MAG: deferrochelatase/peroxidase EfeB [Solirubrobacteraceae bacterium]|nr:deferrochelatase/peroxidase EfeB [Solirubrobacteraceae bacterium]
MPTLARMDGFTRRRLLEAFGVAGAGAALGRFPLDALAAARLPHQGGIGTPAQSRLEFAALTATAAHRAELRDLMRTWSATAAKLRAQHRHSRLTITFGFGPDLFDAGRYGLAGRRPAALKSLPPFNGDELDPAKSDGDLAIQVCANDREVASRAMGRLLRDGKGAASPHWRLAGFGRASSTSRRQRTPRNLMGFKDGTNNIKGDDPIPMRDSVWVGPHDQPAWLRGGSYLVARRIRMRLHDWNATPVHAQERIIGRHRQSGAPLGGKHEHDRVDLNAGVSRGDPVIPTDAHIRLSSPHANRGKRLLRRSYNYRESASDAGLLFLAYQRNPSQFIAIQRRLGERDDALGEFIVHEGSALFACPPGSRRGGFVGQGLL